jgi:3-methyladenine DNA glycosylase AlkC
MAEPFKNLFSRAFFEFFTDVVEQYVPSFERDLFMEQIFDREWDNKELKARARHVSMVLKDNMFEDYPRNLEAILKMIRFIRKNKNRKGGIESMFFPDFIECFGLDHYQISIEAMEEITMYFSCEFAIRPFILKYPEKTMQQMLLWASHHHPLVRRLSTEGCRPRLPWAMSLPFLKKDPSPVLAILEKLKDDAAETVRRSVANNLNDIAKDNPEVVIGIVKKWQGISKETDWVVKHGSRTLLKQANPAIMEIFGLSATTDIKVTDFTIESPLVKIGSSLIFSFKVANNSKKDQLIRLEYGLYYLKANGSLARKVFKISEKIYPAGSETMVVRKQSFKIITTRVFHPGLHKLSIITNGQESILKEFSLNPE